MINMGRPSLRGTRPAGGHGRWGWGSKLWRGKNENLVQIDIIDVDRNFGATDVSLFIPNEL